MRKIVTAGLVAVVIAAAAGGGYVYVQHEAEKQLADTIATVRASLPPGSELTYASASASALSRGAVLDNVTMKTPDGVLTADRLTVSGVGATSADSVEFINAKLVEAKDGTVTAARIEGKNITGVRFIPGPNGGPTLDASTLAFESAQIKTLRTQNIKSDGNPLTVAIGSLTVTDYGAGKRGHGDVSDVQFDAPQDKDFNQMKLHKASVDNIDFPAIITALNTHTKPAAPKAGAGLSIDGFEMSQAGAPRIRLASLNITSHGDNADTDSGTADLKGLEITAPEILASELGQLGYTKFAVDLSLKSTYGHATQTLTLAPLQIDVADMGSLTLTTTLNNVPLNAAKQNPMAFLAVDIAGLDATYTDHSLAKRIETQGATREGLTQEDFVTELQRKMMTSGIGRGTQPATQAFAKAINAFIATPDTLHIVSRPASPVPVMQLGLLAMTNPDEMIRAFGLTAEAK